MANEIPLINKARGADRIVRDIGNKIEGVLNQLNAMGARAESSLNRTVKGIRDVGNAADRTARQINNAANGFGSWAQSADRLGKSLANFNLNVISRGINALITGIQRVYELKERWARITGELNMRIGGLSANVKQAHKLMANWEGKMRGLTDQFGQGAAMAGEFLETLETMNKTVMKSSQMMGLVLARGFNLGGRAAGELLKSFRAMHTTGADVAVDFANLTQLAHKFEVPLNAVAKDIAESSDFMLQFGEDGKKAFMQGAVYLKQFNVSLKDMQRFMSAFDTLDDAAQTVSKLNITFGTTLSSLDMMMTQDPAERFEMVRQQMLAQGKTYDTMSRAQRQILGQTLQLSEKEVAFMLDREKAHLSLSSFREEASKQEVNEQKAQKMMQKQLRATSQTLYAFGAAFDRITVAIAKAIRPLLEMLGLAKSGDKEWKSFGQVMESFTQTFVRLFEGLAKSPQWISFLEKVALQLKKIAKWVTSLTTSDFKNFFETTITWAKRFFVASGALLGLWAGGKALKAISNIGSIMGGSIPGGQMATKLNNRMFGTRVMGGGKTTYRASGMTRATSSLAGAGIGYGMSQMVGDGSVGSNVGGAIGGVVGMLAGPIGSAIGGAVGSWLGANAGKIFDRLGLGKGAATGRGFSEEASFRARRETERLEKNIASIERQKYALDQRITAERKIELSTFKLLSKQQGEKIMLNKTEHALVNDLARGMMTLGVNTGISKERMMELASSNGPLALTKKEIQLMGTATNAYNQKLDKLVEKTGELVGLNEIMIGIERSKASLELKRSTETLKQDRAINELRLMGEKDLAEKIEKEGFAKALDGVGKKAQSTFDEIQEIKEFEKRFEGRRLSSMEKGVVDAKKNERKKLEMELSRFEKIQKVTGPLMRTEEKMLQLKNKELQMKEKELQLSMFEQQLRLLGDRAPLVQKFLQTGGTGVAASMAGAFLTGDEKRLARDYLSTLNDLKALSTPMASGGIVSRPTRALIGENGPEAVIPLRAIASGKLRNPTKFGGAAAQKLVNYAAKSAASGETTAVKIVAGDVYLDSRIVGRHIVREVLENK